MSAVLVSCATTGGRPAPATVSVMTWNTGDATGSHPPAAAVADVIARLGWKDIYVLQEVVSLRFAEDLLGRLRERGGSYTCAYSGAVRIAVLSREEVGQPVSFVAPSSRLGCGAVLVSTTVRGRAVTVVGVHLDPIPKPRDASGRVDMGLFRTLGVVLREIFANTARQREVHEILGWLDSIAARPAILAGDFNTVPSSGAVRLLDRRYVDAADAAGHGSQGTYWRVRFPLKPRVDYVFVSPEVTVREAGVLRRTAGDHYPVAALLELPGSADSPPRLP